MATTTVDFSTLKEVEYDGTPLDNLYVDGIKRWGRYYVQEAYQVWVSSGYTAYTTNDSGWQYSVSPRYHVTASLWSTNFGTWYWAGSQISTSRNASVSLGGYIYYRGALASTIGESRWDYYIKRTWVTSAWVDTSHYETYYRDVYAYYY